MKKRNLLPGFALASLMMLGLAGTAHAYDPAQPTTCNEGGNPPDSSVAGVSINRADSPPGAAYDTCTLGSIEVSGEIALGGFDAYNLGDLTSDSSSIGIGIGGSGPINTGNLTAATDILVAGGNNLGTVTAGTSGSGTVLIWGAGGNLSVGAISNTNGYVFLTSPGLIQTPSITNQNGDVRVFANYEQTSGGVQIIGSGGVGSITNNGDYGYGIYVSDPFGISYNGTNLLQVQAASGPTGIIILDTANLDYTGAPDGTNTGTITLSGLINADGTGSGGGAIFLFADQVVTNNATLTASEPAGQVGAVIVVTNSITNNSGLTIDLNGNNDSSTIDLSIFPIGTFSIVGANSPYYPVFYSDFTPSANPLAITGAGTLAINADGDNNNLQIYGYPLTINSPLTINQKGSGVAATLAGTDGGGNFTTVTLGGEVAIHENTNAAGQTASVIGIYATEVPALGGNVLLDASGTAGGDGGNIYLTPTDGTIGLGGSGSNFALNANGSSSGGNAGTIYAGYGGTLEIALNTANGVTASALGGDGDGGTININGQTLTNGTGAATTIAADGFGTGNGGKISIGISEDLTISGDATAFGLEAKAGSTGNGGEIDVTANNVTIDSSQISVDAGSNGDGGTINIQPFSNLTLNGDLNASGGSTTGQGGTITLSADSITLPTMVSTALIADGNGTGDGGQISITTTSGDVTVTGDDGAFSLEAISNDSGNGGSVSINSPGNVDLDGTAVDVSAGSSGDGNGGTIDITGNQITLSDELDANGQGAGSGGNISLNVTGVTPLDLTGDQHIFAKGGSTGNGGTVVIPNVGQFAVDSVIDVNPDDQPVSPEIAKVPRLQQQKISPLAIGFSPDSTPDGKKTINHVTCQQYFITGGTNAWPTRFWNCAHPGAITPTDEIPATWIATSNMLSPTLLSFIFPTDPNGGNDSPTKLYVFNSADDYNKFFGTHVNRPFGTTLMQLDHQGNWEVDIAIFELPGLTTNTMLETTAHELGHALDNWSSPNNTGADGYWASNIGTYVDFDWDRLNLDQGAGTGPDQGAGTAPCSTTNTAPFDGQSGVAGSVVNTTTNQPVCNEVTGVLSSGTGTNNRTIAENASLGVLGASNSEIFAEAFGWAVYTSTLTNPQYNSYYQKTADGLFANGYFGCAIAWAQYGATAGTGTLSLPSYCH